MHDEARARTLQSFSKEHKFWNYFFARSVEQLNDEVSLILMTK